MTREEKIEMLTDWMYEEMRSFVSEPKFERDLVVKLMEQSFDAGFEAGYVYHEELHND